VVGVTQTADRAVPLHQLVQQPKHRPPTQEPRRKPC
jgi:hypothetical protein